MVNQIRLSAYCSVFAEMWSSLARYVTAVYHSTRLCGGAAPERLNSVHAWCDKEIITDGY